MKSIHAFSVLTLSVALALAPACGDDAPVAPRNSAPLVLPDSAARDFSILDVNTTSPTHDHVVSPRHYVRKVSAWYFGSAT